MKFPKFAGSLALTACVMAFPNSANAGTVRAATPAEIVAIRAAMQTRLKDADSAKFQRVQMIGDSVCGQVNAKNALGAYMGYRLFFGMVFAPSKGGLSKTTAAVLGIADERGPSPVASMCLKEGFALPPDA